MKKAFIQLGTNKAPISPWSKERKNNGRFDVERVKKYPNVAFIPPSSYCVLDCDNAKAIENIENSINIFLEKGILNQRPFSYNTTRGRHYLFKAIKNHPKISSNTNVTIFNTPKNKSKIDLKGNDLGYVQIKKNNINRIDEYVLVDTIQKAPFIPVSFTTLSPLSISIYDFKEGERHNLINKIAIKLNGAGYEYDYFEKLIFEMAILTGAKETLKEFQIDCKNQWASAQKYTAKLGGFNLEKKETAGKRVTQWLKKPEKELVYNRIFNYVYMGMFFNSYFDLIFDIETKQPKILLKDAFYEISKKFDLSKYIDAKSILENVVGKILQKMVGNFDILLISKIVKYLLSTAKWKKNNIEENVVMFANGLFNVKENKEIKEPNPKEFFANVIPHNFLSEAEYLKNIQERNFINNIYACWFGNKWKENKDFLHTIMGAIIAKNRDNDKILFLIGDGGEGKSEFVERMIEIVGKENIAGESFSILSNQFSLINLHQKILNIDSDLELINYEKNTSFIKKIASKEILRAEKKGGSTNYVENYVSMIVNANAIPTIKETGLSRAIRRRLSFISFNINQDKNKMNEKWSGFFKEFKYNKKVLETELYEIMMAYQKNIKKIPKIKSLTHEKCFREFVYNNNNVLIWIKNEHKKWKYNNEDTNYKNYFIYCKESLFEEPIKKIYFKMRIQQLLNSIGLRLNIDEKTGMWLSTGEL